jgi:primary-amine oxidase
MWQCFLYIRDPQNASDADSNHYALPLAISPVIDAERYEVIRIDLLPTGKDNTIKPTEPYKIQPPNEYTPEHQQLRTDLKPLTVIQPEGASFTATKAGETGEVIEWQKWSFRVGFNIREGMVLYDVCFTGSFCLRN